MSKPAEPGIPKLGQLRIAEDGFDFPKLKEITLEVCDILNLDWGVRIELNAAILKNVFHSAQTSIKFHNIENNDVNHYKIIGHIAYWFARLKPLAVVSPRRTKQGVADTLLSFKEKLFGSSVYVDQYLEAAYDEAEVRFEGFKQVNRINEVTALFIALLVIKSCQLEAIDTFYSDLPVEKEALLLQVDHVHEKFKAAFDDTAMSMRYHNYSARAFSFLLERVFMVGRI